MNLKDWKQHVDDLLLKWRVKWDLNKHKSLYAFLSASTLWPIIQAAQAGDAMALIELMKAAGGVGSNLLAERVEQWTQPDTEFDAVTQQLHESLAQHEDLRHALDAVLAKLDTLHAAAATLDEAGRAWMTEQTALEAKAFGFFQQVSGNQNLVFGRVEGSVHIQQVLQREVKPNEEPDPRRRYLRNFLRACYLLPLATLGQQRSQQEGEITLDNVFIELNTTTMIESNKAGSSSAPRKLSSEIAFFEDDQRPLTALEAATQEPMMVLLGEPGSGKSTFLKQYMAKAAERALEDTEASLPVLIVLRDLAERLSSYESKGSRVSRERTLLQFFFDEINALAKQHRAEEFGTALTTAIEDGDCLLAFDGLDEVPYQLQPIVHELVDAVCRQFGLNQLFITCRIRSYHGSARFKGFPDFTLARLNEQQIGDFARAWYRTYEKLGSMTEEEAGAKGDELASAALNGTIRPFAENPMLLTTLAIVHQQNKRLPHHRVVLYEEAVKILLVRWQDEERAGFERIKNEALRQLFEEQTDVRLIIEELAFEAHALSGPGEAAADISRAKILEILDRRLDALARPFLDYVDQKAGILTGQGGTDDRPATYRFPHRTFQEYLAGCYIFRQRNRDRFIRPLADEEQRWGLAVRLGAEKWVHIDGYYQELLDLAATLCPHDVPTPEKERLALWAGHMAALLGEARIAEDEGGAEEGIQYLKRQRQKLIRTLAGQLPPIERAEAGHALASLGDPRPAITRLEAMPFCFIPAGPGRIGADVFGDEQPVHAYPFPDPYWMSVYPITHAQYQYFVDDGGYEEPAFWTKTGWDAREEYQWSQPRQYPEERMGRNQPVIGVSWYEALAYTTWLTVKARKSNWIKKSDSITLPNEVEWEKAARGGLHIPASPLVCPLASILHTDTTDLPLAPNPEPDRRYPWGHDADPNRMNFDQSQIGMSSALGCFPSGAGPNGAQELSGNVWEWNRNQFHQYPYDDHDGREELKGDASRVLRGGAFNVSEQFVRCACRYGGLPDDRVNDVGFRVVLLPSELQD